MYTLTQKVLKIAALFLQFKQLHSVFKHKYTVVYLPLLHSYLHSPFLSLSLPLSLPPSHSSSLALSLLFTFPPSQLLSHFPILSMDHSQTLPLSHSDVLPLPTLSHSSFQTSSYSPTPLLNLPLSPTPPSILSVPSHVLSL